MLAEEQLQEFEVAERAATPGEWLFAHLAGEDCRHLVANHNHQSMTRIADRLLRDLFRPEDARFIAGARTWVPQLLAMVREQQHFIDALKRDRGHAWMEVEELRRQARTLQRERERDYFRKEARDG